MPDAWDPVIYLERAKAWREKAAALPERNSNRAPCLEIAEGYERLAAQLEQRCERHLSKALKDVGRNASPMASGG